LIGISLILFFILFIKRRKQKENKEETKEKTHNLSTLITNMRLDHSSTPNNDIITQNESHTSIYTTLTYSHISYTELVIEKQIGEGSYGKVYLGKWNEGLVALKFCRNRGKLDEFIHEMSLMM
jgi:hypothetical protein